MKLRAIAKCALACAVVFNCSVIAAGETLSVTTAKKKGSIGTFTSPWYDHSRLPEEAP
jgi:hypothetical protein